jgi:hypothetical protein
MNQINEYDKAEALDTDQHVSRCREYSRRKRALLEQFPSISSEEYEKQVKRIAAEVGI